MRRHEDRPEAGTLDLFLRGGCSRAEKPLHPLAGTWQLDPLIEEVEWRLFASSPIGVQRGCVRGQLVCLASRGVQHRLPGWWVRAVSQNRCHLVGLTGEHPSQQGGDQSVWPPSSPVIRGFDQPLIEQTPQRSGQMPPARDLVSDLVFVGAIRVLHQHHEHFELGLVQACNHPRHVLADPGWPCLNPVPQRVLIDLPLVAVLFLVHPASFGAFIAGASRAFGVVTCAPEDLLAVVVCVGIGLWVLRFRARCWCGRRVRGLWGRCTGAGFWCGG